MNGILKAKLHSVKRDSAVGMALERILHEKLIRAFEAFAQAQLVHADILSSNNSLGPDTHAFKIFKTWTLAKILYGEAKLATQLKTEFRNRNYNPGYSKVCEWIDFVAKDPECILEGVQRYCDQIEMYDLEDGIKFRETLIAMAHHFEHNYEELCRIYPEYKTIPMINVEIASTSAHGRPVRARR